MGDVTENRFNGLMAEKKPDRGHLRSHHEGKKWPSRAAPGSHGYDGKGEAEAVSTPLHPQLRLICQRLPRFVGPMTVSSLFQHSGECTIFTACL